MVICDGRASGKMMLFVRHTKKVVKMQRRLFFLCILPLLAVACSADNEPTEGNTSLRNANELALTDIPITKVLKGFDEGIPVLQKKYNVPGVSIALIDNAEVIWAKGFGVLDARRGVAVTPDSVMEVASLSKPFFAYLVLMWAEESNIDLDTPLYTYLGQDYLPNDKRDELITARMVLTHSSGLPNWRAAGNGGTSTSHRWADEIGGQLVFDASMTFESNPATGFVYSGEGFLMLQRAIERQSGLSLSDWANKQLIQPMRLNNTSFGWTSRFKDIAARGHDRNGLVTDQSPSRNSDVNELTTSAGSLYASANDYAKFMIEFVKTDQSESTLLSARGIQKMLTPTAVEIPSENPAVMGLGWMLGEDETGHAVAMHTGNNGDFHALAVLWPTFQDGLVILTNGARGKELIDELTERL